MECRITAFEVSSLGMMGVVVEVFFQNIRQKLLHVRQNLLYREFLRTVSVK